jgi:ribosome maturation factor RimP
METRSGTTHCLGRVHCGGSSSGRDVVLDFIDPSGPVYKDPADPNPADIWSDEDDVLYTAETPEEQELAAQRRYNTYAPKDKNDPPDEPHIPNGEFDNDSVPLYRNDETRDDVAIQVTEEAQLRAMESERPIDLDSIKIDTAALSTIAYAILESLKDREDELRVLSRHEVILSSPGAPDVIETQRQFDAYRDYQVIVETQDPFDSNRTLRGELVDRNAMDLIINKKGQMVTIPLNFVKCVRLQPPPKTAQ